MTDDWSDDLPWLGQYILDENGNPVPAPGLIAWGQWLRDNPDAWRIASDQIGNARVSTVFLGLDVAHICLRLEEGFDPTTYKPVLWETMVFGGPYDMYQMRYTSKEDALAGHGKVIQMLTS